MKTRLIILVAVFLCISGSVPTAPAQAPEAPVVYWSAEPVMPGETALLQGARWDGTAVVSLARLDDVTGAVGNAALREAPLLDANPRSLRFVVPADWQRGVVACRIKTASGEIEQVLNAPQPWWFQADEGQRASPGGWLRVFGRCLALKEPRCELRRRDKTLALKLRASSLWQLTMNVPAEVAAGDHELWVHNGCGGPAGWVRAGRVTIQPRDSWWGLHEFDVTAFGATPDDDTDDGPALSKALAKAAEHGGGVVKLPPGRFRLSGYFTLPPRVLLKGAGAGLTHLCWADSNEPPEALLSSTTGECGIEDLSLYAFNYRNGVKVGGPKKQGAVATRPKHVLIRRVRARFTPLSVRGMKPEAEAKRREALAQAAVFRIDADNVQILDCDIACTRNLGFAVSGDDVVCRGNHVRIESSGWCPVGGGRRALVEGNTFDGVTTGVTRGAEVYFAHNRCAHQYHGFREGFTTDGTYGGGGILKVAAVTGTRLELAEPATRTEPPRIPAVVRILQGVGEGQFRRVVSCDGNGIVLERPWDISPDASSVLWLSNDLGRHLIVENEWADCGIAVQLFGGALDCVVAGNRSARSGGFRVWGNSTAWYVQFLGNHIPEGYGVEGPELAGGQSSVHVIGPYLSDPGKRSVVFKGTTARGIVIRGNRLDAHATITLRGAIHDVLAENNTLRHSTRGIVGDLWQRQQGILLRGNTFDQVAQPLSPPEARKEYREVK